LLAVKRKVKENSNTTDFFAEKCSLSLAQIASKSALNAVNAVGFLFSCGGVATLQLVEGGR